MNTIQAQWKEFEARVISKNAPDVQRKEMRIAFYAGASSMLAMTESIADDSVSEDAAVEILQGFHEEAAMFVSQLVNGQPIS